MTAYYNEHEPFAAAWLRHLIEEGAIAHGHVDERPIQAVEPDDLRGFAQCHFFAGVGVWSYALRLAGWPDDEPVWTGSCPCQPFSAAGQGKGFDDPRHLWPDFLRLIRECRPNRVLGEQVAKAGDWLDLVSTDLEALGFAVGSVDLPAAGFGGAHIRQRFYWVADAHNAERWTERAPRNDGDWPATGRVEGDCDTRECGPTGGMANADGRFVGNRHLQPGRQYGQLTPDDSAAVWLGDTQDAIWWAELKACGTRCRGTGPSGTGSPDWLWCRDGQWRPVEPGASPLATETPARVGRLRGYGNALDAETAANFIGAYLDALNDCSARPIIRELDAPRAPKGGA